MTKYGKTKKLMEEYSISKQEAGYYLRRASGDINKARAIIKAKRLVDIIDGFEFDWEAIGKAMRETFDAAAEAIRKTAESIRDILDDFAKNPERITSEWPEHITKDPAAAGASKEEIMDRLGNTSEEEGDTE